MERLGILGKLLFELWLWNGTSGRECASSSKQRCNGETIEYRMCNCVCLDCEQIYRRGFINNAVYNISPDNRQPFYVYCDMTYGGWTFIQRRVDGIVAFNRRIEYVTGFGDLEGSFWLGLEKIHRLTREGSQIFFDLENLDGSKEYATNKAFRVGSALTAYTMNVDNFGYNGSIPDLFSYHDGMKFSTYDRDNDFNSESNCAVDSGIAAGGSIFVTDWEILMVFIIMM